MEEKAKQVAELLKILANENRLLLLCALIEEPKTVGQLCEFVPKISQSGVSQHLATLKAHGLLDNEKKGQSITYFIADKRVMLLLDLLKQQYCS